MSGVSAEICTRTAYPSIWRCPKVLGTWNECTGADRGLFTKRRKRFFTLQKKGEKKSEKKKSETNSRLYCENNGNPALLCCEWLAPWEFLFAFFQRRKWLRGLKTSVEVELLCIGKHGFDVFLRSSKGNGQIAQILAMMPHGEGDHYKHGSDVIFVFHCDKPWRFTSEKSEPELSSYHGIKWQPLF